MKLKAILTAIVLCGLANLASAQTEQPVKPFGTFMRVFSDGEHASGYSIELWRQGDKIIGMIDAHQGLIGDPPAGLLENVQYDEKSGSFSFTAKLSLGFYSENKGSHDRFWFNGTLTKTRLAGNLRITDEICGSSCSEKKKINLPRSQEWSKDMLDYKTYAEWKKDMDEILSFRGPRW